MDLTYLYIYRTIYIVANYIDDFMMQCADSVQVLPAHLVSPKPFPHMEAWVIDVSPCNSRLTVVIARDIGNFGHKPLNVSLKRSPEKSGRRGCDVLIERSISTRLL